MVRLPVPLRTRKPLFIPGFKCLIVSERQHLSRNLAAGNYQQVFTEVVDETLRVSSLGLAGVSQQLRIPENVLGGALSILGGLEPRFDFVLRRYSLELLVMLLHQLLGFVK